ncbi:MAG: glycosyltransferase family 9 protein [Planctomycetota bacterium]
MAIAVMVVHDAMTIAAEVWELRLPHAMNPPKLQVDSRRALPVADSITRIGCLMLGGIGDILTTTPTLAALKVLYPQASLVLVLRRRLAPLVNGNPHVDAVIPYDSSNLAARFEFFRSLRRERFDLWVDLHTPTFHTVSSLTKVFLRNSLIMRIAKTGNRLGYAVRFLRRRLTHAVEVPGSRQLASENIVDTTLALVGPPPGTSRRKIMAVSEDDRDWAKRTLPADERTRFSFFFGGRQSANHWPAKRAATFVNLLLTRFPAADLVLIGDRHEVALTEAMLEHVDSRVRARVVDLVGCADLGQTAAVFERCTVAISTDSGPMHIADAVGVPLVALFCGKTPLPIWVPTGERSVVLYHHVSCAPCLLAECPHSNLCMDSISPDEVLRAVIRFAE